jgi:hydrogenase maturation protease
MQTIGLKVNNAAVNPATCSENSDLSVSSPGGRLIIIGLGNEFISDDGVGIFAVRRLRERMSQLDRNVSEAEAHFLGSIVIEELASGGLQILDAITGYERCFIIDAVLTDTHPPGTIYRYVQRRQKKPVKLASSHQINLSEVLGLAKLLNVNVPPTINVYGVEVSDITTFSTGCTSEVQKALPQLVDVVWHDLPMQPDGFRSGPVHTLEFPRRSSPRIRRMTNYEVVES